MSASHAVYKIIKIARLPLPIVTAALIIHAANCIVHVIECIYYGGIIDAASKGFSEFLFPLVMISAITFCEYIFFIPGEYLATRFIETGLRNLRVEIGSRICFAPYKSLEASDSGDLMSRTMSDINAIGKLWKNVLLWFFESGISFLLALVLCISLNWKLTLIGFMFIPIVLFIALKMSKKVEKASFDAKVAGGLANKLLYNIITGLATLKSFTLHDIMLKKYQSAMNCYVKAETNAGKVTGRLSPAGELIYYLPFLTILISGCIFVISGEMTAGMYISFTFTFGYVSGTLFGMQEHIVGYRTGTASVKRILEILDIDVEKPGIGRQESISDTIVSVRNLSFSYSPGNEILHDISFDLKKGQILALVGHSGCGKSTLVRVISGLYPVETGRVVVGGFPSSEENQTSIRNQISIVSQENFLFPSSIMDNIRIGRPGATEAEVYEAGKNAGIHDFIMSLPKQYDTDAGERGACLSGGQIQRICIARAFIKNSGILILDEPTSALDAMTESVLQQSIEKLMQGKTVIIAAHRLSSIKNANRILVMKDGGIVESGTHRELISTGEIYPSLYRQQFHPQEDMEFL